MSLPRFAHDAALVTSHARRVARSAVIHGLPAVDLHRRFVRSALDRLSPEYQAPVNDLVEIGMRTDPVAPRPSPGGPGPQSWYAWLDLRAEPVVLTVPGAVEGPGVQAELIDLRGASKALTRSPDGSGGAVLIRGPRWHGPQPTPSVAMECPTEIALLLIAERSVDGHDPGGYPHDRPGLHTLSTWLGRPAPAPPLPPAVPDLAVVDVRAPLDAHFLHVLDVMLPLMPARTGEELLRAELASFGIGGAAPTALPSPAFPPAELEAGLGDGVAEVRRRCSPFALGDGAHPSHRELHADYLSRAATAYLGWYQPELHIRVLVAAGL
jgi:hypothetical protein